MMTLVAAALAAAAPASAADAHAQHQQGPSGHHQMDCCKDKKADCKDCCEDMEKMHSGSEHSERAEHQQ